MGSRFGVRLQWGIVFFGWSRCHCEMFSDSLLVRTLASNLLTVSQPLSSGSARITFRGECRGRLHPHSCSTLALACFLDCWGELPSIFYLPSSVGRVIERACVCLSLGSARVVGRRRCCYASRHARVATEGHCGGRSRSRARSAFALALLVGAKLLSEVASLPLVVTCGCEIVARSRSCLR